MGLLETAFSEEALHESMMEIKKNIGFKYSVQDYCLNELKEIQSFRKAYANGTFKFSKCQNFCIHERGKVRYIQPVAFRDRVVIHSFCKNVLEKNLKPYLIYDNCASLKGKGIDKQLDRFRVHLQKFYRLHGTEGYILQVDFTKYFDNIQHEKAIELIGEKIPDKESMDFLRLALNEYRVDVSYMTDEEYARCMDEIFDSLKYSSMQYPQVGKRFMAKSVGIGNEISQIIGLFYLSRLDNYIKIVESVKFYGRYMDDLYVIHEDRDYLKSLLTKIKSISRSLGLSISERKTRINKVAKPIKFLKTIFMLTETGKILKRKVKDTFVRQRRKLKKLYGMMEKRVLSYKDIERQFKSWRGTVTRKHYKNFRQVARVDRLYNNLFIKSFIEGSYAGC